MRFSASLKATILWSIVLAAIVPAVALTIWQVEHYYDLLLEKSLETESVINLSVAKHISAEVGRLSTILENKADPLALALEQDDSATEDTVIRDLIAAMMAREDAIHAVIILRRQGEVVAATEREIGFVGANHPLQQTVIRSIWPSGFNADSPAFVIPSHGRKYIGPVVTFEHGSYSEQLFTLALPIVKKQEVVGILYGQIDTRMLWQQLETQQQRKDVMTYLTDSRGSLLVQPKVTSYQTGDFLTRFSIVRTMLADLPWNAKQIYTGLADQPVYGTAAAVEMLDWNVISEIPTDVITAPIIQPLKTAVLIITIVILLFMLISVAFVARIIKPIDRITKAFDTVAKGNFSISLPRSIFKEIITLNQGFNSMIQARLQTEHEQKKLSLVVEQSHNVVIITDTEGNIEYVNPQFIELTGFTNEEVQGENFRILKSGANPKEVYEELWCTVLSGQVWQGELVNCKKNGEFYRSAVTVSPIRNEAEHIIQFLAMERDISKEYELTQQLIFQAKHDSLTGLINRYEFEKRLNAIVTSAIENDAEHVLCYMDLDQFKVVNDTCGHLVGDELLKQVSQALQSVIRLGDTLARLGGDEFAVLVENCSLESAQPVANKLLDVIGELRFQWDGQVFNVGVSIGLVAITTNTTSPRELLQYADAACYAAKDLGRNRTHVYQPDDEQVAQLHGEMRWVSRINQALEEDLFELYAQPIARTDNSDDLFNYFEILIRMRGPDGSVIPPGAFLPAAERYNLSGKLDAWVIQHTFEFLTQHQDFLSAIKTCSINLSGPTLAEPRMLEFITGQLQQQQIPAEKICFEITETAAISNLNTATQFISSLKQMGCQFALDDFGTGLSSFSYLKNLSVDYLKIDGSFVKDIVEDPIDRATVKSINEIGHVVGKKTVAEFVESQAIQDELQRIGVDYVQGYHIGKPKPLEAYAQHRKRHSNQPEGTTPALIEVVD